MNFIKRISPNYRTKLSTMRIMTDLTLALIVLTIASAVYYTQKVSLAVGLRVIYVVLVAVIVNIALELIYGKIKGVSPKDVFKQQFPWVTGLILALCIPVATNLYVVGMTTAIGVIFGKLVFGGFGQNIFNPAGIGRAIVLSSFSKPIVESVLKTNDVFTNATPANLFSSFKWLPSLAAFESKAFAHMGLKELALGDHYGSIGETFALLIIILGIFLAIRKVIDYRIPLVYVGTLFISAFIIGSINGLGIWYPIAFVMSGGVLFGAVFMLTDPVTCPTQVTGRVVFAFGAAIITLLIRFKANLPEGVVFSILIMNMLTPMIEDFFDGQQTRMKKKYLTTVVSMLVIVGLSITWIATTVKAQEPVLDLGTPVLIDEEKSQKYEAEIIDTKADGGNTVYTVAVEGYGLRDAEYPNPNYQENIFEVTVDGSNKIVSAAMTQFGDTEGFGDKINDDLYFEKFIGKDLLSASEEFDVVSGATITSYSFIKALYTISLELGA